MRALVRLQVDEFAEHVGPVRGTVADWPEGGGGRVREQCAAVLDTATERPPRAQQRGRAQADTGAADPQAAVPQFRQAVARSGRRFGQGADQAVGLLEVAVVGFTVGERTCDRGRVALGAGWMPSPFRACERRTGDLGTAAARLTVAVRRKRKPAGLLSSADPPANTVGTTGFEPATP
ncbi:hypothetical protein LXH13_33590 [Streptomyces spinosirectus]|uniref:hypothetical protein n=1 Tax=Streptomyces TaxID=1883 RepID=UPI000D3B94C0|nr:MULTISPECIES: hypothetical protein [Streptomyces]MBY8342930.1 hypothetical protein [Streptomyces plumbidurans]UIR21671.1 hypothetical protein LXH13_33590 [Streptomyces spinosirectus]